MDLIMSFQEKYTHIQKGKLFYEGKAKRIYHVLNQPDLVLHEFKDSLTAFNGEKSSSLKGKGQLNTAISEMLFQHLETVIGFKTHFIAQKTFEGNKTMLLTQKLQMIPLEVVVRNKVAGSLKTRLGLEEGTTIKPALLEFYFKSDKLKDPLINKGHILLLKIADQEDLSVIKSLALNINTHLKSILNLIGLTLVDFKLEFGRDKNNKLVLGDEISPDTCRIWDTKTGEKLDKDCFRYDLGDVKKGYQIIKDKLAEITTKQKKGS